MSVGKASGVGSAWPAMVRYDPMPEAPFGETDVTYVNSARAAPGHRPRAATLAAAKNVIRRQTMVRPPGCDCRRGDPTSLQGPSRVDVRPRLGANHAVFKHLPMFLRA